MAKPDRESLSCVRKSWIGGNGTMYLGIPSAILQKIGITRNSYLLVDVMYDIIIIKKLKTGLTKREIEKVRNYHNHEEEIDDKEENNMIGHTLPDDFKNPLDELDDI
jgi:bifunctional DNA-binding transcriptional regulator/antitoxin component of YhaV-PrlF toxin-antitoxin module